MQKQEPKKDYEKKLEEILSYVKCNNSFNSLNIINNAKSICIFGTGKMFEEAYEEYFVKRSIKVDYVSDNNPEKWGKFFHGLECISPEKLAQIEGVVVIPLIGNSLPVEKQLHKYGITTINMLRYAWDITSAIPTDAQWFEENIPKIRKVYHLLADDESRRIYVNILCNRMAPELAKVEYSELYAENEKQYFAQIDGFHIGDHETFCDAGAFTGDTILDIIEETKGKFDGIYAFEMDHDNFQKCQENVKLLDKAQAEKIHCYNYGVWDEDTIICSGREENSSKASNSIMKAKNMNLREDEVQNTKTICIDTFLEDVKITFLKMDIEGAELHALKGAKRMIQTKKPKLAICVYHSPADIWEIPLYILSLVPEYKICMRHYSDTNFWETVCYAYINDEQ